MNEPTTQVVDVEAISVEDGFNPRTGFDEARLAELEASIRQSGLVTALTVRPNGNGGFVLIAGQRRLIAAQRAGVKKVPVVIREDEGALAAAIAENLIRSDLDPVEEAMALQRLAEAEKLGTHKKVAERVGRSAAYVSERLRLLSLPEGAQRQIAAGKVPVAAERELRKVAKVSPRIAECACELVAKGEIDGRDLVERFDEVLHTVAQAEFTEKPTMIEVGRGAWLSELVPDPEQHRALLERFQQAYPYDRGEDAVLRLSEAEVDAARAAGCLLEHEVDHGGWVSTVAYICDAVLAADLAVRVIERIEKDAARRAKEEAERAGAELPDGDPATLAEQIREARRAEREKAKSDAEAARRFNLELGRKLLGRRGAKSRKEHSLARAKAVAAVVLADNDNLAARGLRLVLPQLQEVEIKELRSGEKRERVTYQDPADCNGYLVARIEEARSADQVLELLADALIAATEVDERELAQSRRVAWWCSAEQKIGKLLGADAKAVRPRRTRARK